MSKTAMELHATTDASVWTDEFLRIFPEGTADPGTLLGWFANAIETGRDAARLSHDRGADAWYQQAKRGTEQWVELFEAHNRGDDLGLIFERHVSEASDAIEAALSVPAPTLPALDALLHEVWELYHDCAIGQDVSYPSRPELHPAVEPDACSDDVCVRVREALRDAV